jgi:MFS family permease
MKLFDSTPREKSPLRWLILILCCISTFGDYYCFDNPGAVHDHLESQFDFLGINFEYYYNLLYSIYSIVNIFIPFIGGNLIKIYGNKNMFLIFALIIVIGQLIVYIGCKNNSIYTMLVGRIIFGLGGDNLNVSQMTCVIEWFYKSESSFPMGLTLTISRIGSFFNDVLSPRLAGDTRDINGKLNATNAFKWGFYFSIFSLINVIIMYILDYYKTKALSNNEIVLNNNIENDNENNNNNMFTLLIKLNLMFWVISLLILLNYGCLMPFNYMAVGFYTKSHNLSKNLAGILMGMPFIMGAFFVPILGVFVDKYGYRSELVFSSGFFVLFSFILFNFIKPYFPISLLGFGYSIFACVLWPAISIPLKDKNLAGFGYGVASGLQNISMSINPMIIAQILVKYNSYFYCLIFLIIMTCISIVLSGYLYLININKYNYILNRINYEDEITDEKNKNINSNINIEIPDIQNKNYNELDEEK